MVAWRIVENGVLMQGISNQIGLIFKIMTMTAKMQLVAALRTYST
jgi:hypothetical protein